MPTSNYKYKTSLYFYFEFLPESSHIGPVDQNLVVCTYSERGQEATKASRGPLPPLCHNKIQELDKISKELPLLKVLVAAPAASTPLPPTPAPASAPLLPPSLSPAPTSTPASAPLISPATRSAPAQL